MRRTRPATSMFDPKIYQLMQEVEPNISWYIYEVVCADLLKRGKLTMQDWLATQGKDDEASQPTAKV